MTQHLTKEQVVSIRESCYGQGSLEQFYQAMMEAAIQWHIEQRSKELPVLPDGYLTMMTPDPDGTPAVIYFTDDMEAYALAWGDYRAAQAREEALEDAKQVCRDFLTIRLVSGDEGLRTIDIFHRTASICAGSIEALKKAGK